MLERCFVTIFGIAQVHLLYTCPYQFIYHSEVDDINASTLNIIRNALNMMIYAVVSYACLVGGKVRIHMLESPANVQTSSMKPLQSITSSPSKYYRVARTLNLCMGLTCFGTMEGASQPTLEMTVSAQPLGDRLKWDMKNIKVFP
jgi:hypothetical protein